LIDPSYKLYFPSTKTLETSLVKHKESNFILGFKLTAIDYATTTLNCTLFSFFKQLVLNI